MNTHDKIKLPPLPYPYGTPAYRTVGSVIEEYARAAIEAYRQQPQLALDGVYTQRNALAIAFAKAAIAAGWVAGRGFDSDAPKGWSDDWRHVVYVDLPDGRQASWHMSPECVPLLDGLPEYTGAWDGTSIARDAEWCRFSYDRQQRGEPVGYINPAHIGQGHGSGIFWAKDQNFNKPVYEAPQPAETNRRKLLEGLAEADGCFRAAYIEGLTEALSETTDARLKDLIERRILYAHHAIVEAISQPPRHADPAQDQDTYSMQRAQRDCSKDAERNTELKEPSDDNSITIAYMSGFYVGKRSTTPEGWQLVPKEPDYKMKEAARNAPIPAVLLDSISARADLENTSIYKAMLLAAPKFGEEK